MNLEELSQRLEKLEKQMGYSLGNQISIIELQERLNNKINDSYKGSGRKSEFAVILNYFLLSLVFYGLFLH